MDGWIDGWMEGGREEREEEREGEREGWGGCKEQVKRDGGKRNLSLALILKKA